MATLRNYFETLREHFGPQHWWPGETPFEVMVGAILTQNTAWSNVDKAIRNLKTYNLLDPHKLHELDQDTLALAIKPAGYFNVKARRLKSFIEWFVTKYAADVEALRRVPPHRLREELLEVKGIGPETADSILLYALGVPSFVVDAYTWRVLTRHGLLGEEASYDDMKELFEKRLPQDAELYNEFHALLVAVGKDYCRPRARCEECPLKRYLPGEMK
jgi:endonuclease III related protein